MPRVVAETVAAPIEQQVNGVEKMLYMQSSCNERRCLQPRQVTFEQGVNMNMAQVLVQNRVNLAGCRCSPMLSSRSRRDDAQRCRRTS